MRRGGIVALLIGALAALLAGCGGSEPGAFDQPSTTLYETFTADNWAELAADPKAKRGATVGHRRPGH